MNSQNLKEKTAKLYEMEKTVIELASNMRLSPSSVTHLETAKSELDRTRDIVWVNSGSNAGLSEALAIDELDPDILENEVMTVGSSTQNGESSPVDAPKILLPPGSKLLEDRNFLVISPLPKHVVRGDVVEKILTADAILFESTKRISDEEKTVLDLVIALSKTGKRQSPQIGCVYTSKDTAPEDLKRLIQANASAFSQADVENYIVTVDEDRLITELANAARKFKFNVMKQAVTGLLPDIEVNIENISTQIKFWRGELAKRQTYDDAVEKRGIFHEFRRVKTANLKAVFDDSHRKIAQNRAALKQAFKPYNSGPIVTSIMNYINSLSNRDLSTEKRRKETLSYVETLLRDLGEKALEKSNASTEKEILKPLRLYIEKIVQEILDTAGGGDGDFEVKVEQIKPEMPDTKIAYWLVEIRSAISRECFTFVIATSMGASLGIAAGTVFPGVGNVVGGIIGGILGALGGIKVIRDERTNAAKARFKEAVRNGLVDINDAVLTHYDQIWLHRWKSIEHGIEAAFEMTEEKIRQEVHRFTDVSGFTSTQLNEAIQDAESQLEQLNQLRSDIQTFCASDELGA